MDEVDTQEPDEVIESKKAGVVDWPAWKPINRKDNFVQCSSQSYLRVCVRNHNYAG